ncbi:hypothetical protein AAFO92_13480 [Roseovarius sp. CAU 1744]
MAARNLCVAALLGSTLALTACGPQNAEITQSDLHVQAAGPAKDRVVGALPLVVRTYVKDSDGKDKEVSGATCRFQSREVSAKVTSPRRLVLPTYAQGARFKDRGAPAPVIVSCRGDGRKGATRITPVPIGSGANTTDKSTAYSGGTSLNVNTTSLTRRMASANPWMYGVEVKVVLK